MSTVLSSSPQCCAIPRVWHPPRSLPVASWPPRGGHGTSPDRPSPATRSLPRLWKGSAHPCPPPPDRRSGVRRPRRRSALEGVVPHAPRRDERLGRGGAAENDDVITPASPMRKRSSPGRQTARSRIVPCGSQRRLAGDDSFHAGAGARYPRHRRARAPLGSPLNRHRLVLPGTRPELDNGLPILRPSQPRGGTLLRELRGAAHRLVSVPELRRLEPSRTKILQRLRPAVG